MTEFALTLLRLAFLGALWLFIIITVIALRRDLMQPREARPAATRASTRPPKPAKPAKAPNMMLIEAVVGAAPGGLKVLPPLIVHELDGSYTPDVLKYYQ